MNESQASQKVATGDVTREGERLLSCWLNAQEELQRAKNAVSRGECEVRNTESALAKWLMPPDMKPDEKIGVWVGDSLFQVELEPRDSFSGDGERHVSYEPKVTIRTRGKNFWRLK